MGINRRRYYEMLSTERYRLLAKLERSIGTIHVVGGNLDRIPRLVRVARKVEATARYFEIMSYL